MYCASRTVITFTGFKALQAPRPVKALEYSSVVNETRRNLNSVNLV